MKPLLLEIEGINSFKERQTLDFEKLSSSNLFCISGNTGSGKTTVLDCILLALFEKPGDRGNLADYINLGSESGFIGFDFELENSRYRIERVLKKTGANKARLILNGIVIKENGGVFDFIYEKTGLSKDEFTRVVVLQQGEFAKFLSATKTEKKNVVISLFKLGRFKKAAEGAKNRRTEYEKELGIIDASLKSLEDATPETYKSAKEDLEKNGVEKQKTLVLIGELEKKRKVLEEKRKAFLQQEDYKKQLAALALKRGEIESRQQSLDKEAMQLKTEGQNIAEDEKRKEFLIGLKPMLIAAKKLDGEIAQIRAKIEGLKKDYNSQSERLKEEESGLNAAEEKGKRIKEEIGRQNAALLRLGQDEIDCEKPDASERAVRLLSESEQKGKDYGAKFKEKSLAQAKLAEAQKQRDIFFERWEKGNNAFTAYKEEIKKAEEQSRFLGEMYEDAQREDLAAALCEGLKKGDICPVCGGVIEEIKTANGESALLKKRLAEAQAELKAAEKKSADCDGEIKLAANNTAAFDKTIEELSSAIKQTEDALAEYNEETEKKKRECYKKIKENLAAETALKKTLSEIEMRRLQADENLKRIAGEGSFYKGQLAEKKTEREKIAESDIDRKLAETESELEEIRKVRENYERQKAEAEKSARDIVADRAVNETETKRISGLVADVEEVKQAETDSILQQAEDAKKELGELNINEGRLTALIDRLKTDLAKKESLKKQRETAEKQYKLADTLFSALKNGEFEQFVSAEYIKDFTYSASGLLAGLSQGKYTLDYDEETGDFYVTDFLSGNERRRAKTLSGGETFLASLSLAIAISKQISDSMSYEFFFIDEGFGTLDEGALSTVYDALYKLSENTLVGVITHRAELKELIPDTVTVLPSDGETGSRIV